MGRKIQKKLNWKRLLAMLLVAIAIAAAINPVNAQAKTKKKTITLKVVSNYDSQTTAKKKSTTVKTGYIYTVKLKQYMALSYGGYLKFKAPKTKTYKFTVSGVKHPVKKSILQGTVSFKNPTAYGFFPIYVKTRGKKTDRLYVAAKTYKPGFSDATNYYTSRTGTVKLKKGQTVYLNLDFNTMTYTKKPISVNVNIK